MHKRILSVALSTAFSLGIALAAPQEAQDQSQQQQPQPAQGRRGGMQAMDPDAQLKHMTKALKLSDDQAAQIKPILVDRQTQMASMRGDTTMSREDKMAKMKSIRDDSDTKIKAILNDDQKTQYAAMQQQNRDRMQQHMGSPSANR